MSKTVNIKKLMIVLTIFLIAGALLGIHFFILTQQDRIGFVINQPAKWKYNITDFQQTQNAYSDLAGWAKENFGKYLTDGTEFIEISVGSGADSLRYKTACLVKGELTYENLSGDKVQMTDSGQQSLSAVQQSFKNGLKYILLHKDMVSFIRDYYSYEQCYAVSYVYDGSRPDYMVYKDERRKLTTKIITDKWYHVADLPENFAG